MSTRSYAGLEELADFVFKYLIEYMRVLLGTVLALAIMLIVCRDYILAPGFIGEMSFGIFLAKMLVVEIVIVMGTILVDVIINMGKIREFIKHIRGKVNGVEAK
jgi:uncharacterized protein HemY